MSFNVWRDSTKQQQAKAENMMLHYMRGIRKTHKMPGHILEAWAQRYYVATLMLLQRQDIRLCARRHIPTRSIRVQHGQG